VYLRCCQVFLQLLRSGGSLTAATVHAPNSRHSESRGNRRGDGDGGILPTPDRCQSTRPRLRSHHTPDTHTPDRQDTVRHNTLSWCSGLRGKAEPTIYVSLCSLRVLTCVSKVFLYNNFVVKIMPINNCTNMLSHEAEKKLKQLDELLRQRAAINRKIEHLLLPVPPSASPSEPPVAKRQRQQPKRAAPAAPKSIKPRFSDAEIKYMMREYEEEGKTAGYIVRKYGFSSIPAWYVFKSNYKKKQLVNSQRNDLPEFDEADDEEEPEDEPVVGKTSDNMPCFPQKIQLRMYMWLQLQEHHSPAVDKVS
jgi:hypothetical protein